MPILRPSDPDARVPRDATAERDLEEAVRALRHGPVGAFIVSAIAVGLLLAGWLAFYLFVFLRRGAIG